MVEDGCAETTRSVYVLGKGRELVRFDPATLTFDTVGLVACPVNGGPAIGVPTPFSMAVDRTGTAWVLYSDGTLYNVDVTTASCSSTDFMPNQLQAFELFGMGFVADAPGSLSETLFLSSYSPGDGIARLNMSNLAVERVGFYNMMPGAAELTGTGDARLFGFFVGNPVHVSELDSNDSDLLDTIELPNTTIGAAWAFAFWGGDFWLFTSENGTTSQVDRVRPNGVIERVVDDVGLLVVGAGVSTCAPVVPPT